MVCLRAGEGIVGEGQGSEGGLHGVGHGPRAAVPGEPGAELAEKLRGETALSCVYRSLRGSDLNVLVLKP